MLGGLLVLFPWPHGYVPDWGSRAILGTVPGSRTSLALPATPRPAQHTCRLLYQARLQPFRRLTEVMVRNIRR
jgi:hypothetical protein